MGAGRVKSPCERSTGDTVEWRGEAQCRVSAKREGCNGRAPASPLSRLRVLHRTSCSYRLSAYRAFGGLYPATHNEPYREWFAFTIIGCYTACAAVALPVQLRSRACEWPWLHRGVGQFVSDPVRHRRTYLNATRFQTCLAVRCSATYGFKMQGWDCNVMKDRKTTIRRTFESQLPRRRALTIVDIVGLISGAVTILFGIGGGILLLVMPDYKHIPIINNLYFLMLLTFCIGYIVYRELSTKHKFSEYVVYSHYVNHIFRDYMESAKTKADKDDIINDICDKASEIFSITCGKKCYCVIKTINPATWDVFERYGDKISVTRGLDIDNRRINEWTSMSSIISGDCPRYYMCDDIVDAFRRRKYDNPRLTDYELNSIWYAAREWPLPFRSTIVTPIRYIDNSMGENGVRYFGFLCIDCISRRTFDVRYHPEMAAAFADLIYVIASIIEPKNY